MNEPTPQRPDMRMFQISEDDLADLERIIPELFHRLFSQMDNATRIKWRKVQDTLSNVRWQYGPPGEIVTIPADDGGGK